MMVRAMLFLLLGLMPAFAQPAPRIRPTRDVTATYKLDGPALDLIPGGIQGPVRLSWDAGGQRVRAESDGRSQLALLDLKAHTGQVVDSTLRIILPLRIHEKDLQLLTLEGAHLVPHGHETIAGLACAVYSFDTDQGPGTVCLTADGVALRGQGKVRGKLGGFTAVSVSYGALPASLFEPPPGYISLAGAPVSQGDLGNLAQRLMSPGGLNSLRGLLGPGR